MPIFIDKIFFYILAIFALQMSFINQLSAQTSSQTPQVAKVNDQTFSIFDPQANLTAAARAKSKTALPAQTYPPVLLSSEKEQIKNQASSFLQKNSEYFKIKNINDLKLLGIRKDSLQRASAVYQQTLKGVPILGAYLRTLSNAEKLNQVYYASGHFLDLNNQNINTTPKLSPLDAQLIAIEYILKNFKLPELKQSFADPQQRGALLAMLPTTLYLYNESLLRGKFSNESTDFKLLYLVETNISFDIAGIVKVDAITGQVYEFIDSRLSATKHTISDCSSGCYCPVTLSGTEGPPVSSNDTYKMYDYFEKFRSYFLAEYGRNGASGVGGIGDGLQTKLDENRGFANYNGCNSASCINGGAWFSNSPRALNFCTGSLSLDVFGHEYFHAFNASNIINSATGATSILLNQYESGAINEAFADSFGEDFASYYDAQQFDWLFGTNSSLLAKRSLGVPQQFTYRVAATNKSYSYPDRYSSDSFYCGSENNGGVHWNSTVISKAVFLASVGTRYLNLVHNKFNGCKVIGIGLYKVTQILFHTMVSISARISNFNELYEAINMGCSLLINDPANIHNVTESDCLEFKNAMQAVELNFPTFGQCKPERYVPSCVINPIYGDFNLDGYVNELDRSVWALNYGKTVPEGYNLKLAGDINNDNNVDMDDYTLWRDIKGFQPIPISSPSPSPVPQVNY